MVATSRGRQNIAALLLRRGADPNMEDRNGRTPLVMAIRDSWSRHSMLRICRLLLEIGADAAKVARNGETALSTARYTECQGVEELLPEWMSENERDGS